MTIEEQKYPIGRFRKPEEITKENLETWIREISSLPKRLREAVKDLTNEELDTPYREGGWTLRQVVNHCADSHMNALLRIKLALTEDKPTISAYFEERWAELEDSKSISIQPAILMLQGIHERWTVLLNSLSEEQLERTFIHPSHGKEVSVKEVIALYAWHGNHHLAHIEMLQKKKNRN